MKQVDTLTMNPAVDVSVSASQVLPEEKLRCSRPSFEPGGGGINVSRALSKLGGSSAPIVLAGGHNGNLLSELMESDGLKPEVLPIISKVGAGDSMVAGITYGLANDNSLTDSAGLGVAAGAAAVMTPGTELCRRDDT
ncbi:MAG: PfkB family carbohydrate kinase, partial [Candidatus Aenigmatarchaeota archaeon]